MKLLSVVSLSITIRIRKLVVHDKAMDICLWCAPKQKTHITYRVNQIRSQMYKKKLEETKCALNLLFVYNVSGTWNDFFPGFWAVFKGCEDFILTTCWEELGGSMRGPVWWGWFSAELTSGLKSLQGLLMFIILLACLVTLESYYLFFTN